MAVPPRVPSAGFSLAGGLPGGLTLTGMRAWLVAASSASFAALAVVRASSSITSGFVCEDGSGASLTMTERPLACAVRARSNQLPLGRAVEDYCPYGIGGWYCGAYKACPSGVWGDCLPDGSGIRQV